MGRGDCGGPLLLRCPFRDRSGAAQRSTTFALPATVAAQTNSARLWERAATQHTRPVYLPDAFDTSAWLEENNQGLGRFVAKSEVHEELAGPSFTDANKHQVGSPVIFLMMGVSQQFLGELWNFLWIG